MSEIKAWHFVRENKRLGYGDNNIVAPGYTYSVDGELSMCEWGLHASINPLDALNYAPGPIVCRVVLSGDMIKGDDKICARERTVLWMADASETLHLFACDVAQRELDRQQHVDPRSQAAIDAKRKWLKGEITDAELAAAWDTARGAARDAATAAARDAARVAAGAAAWDTAGGAARAAAWAAAEVAEEKWQRRELTKRFNRLKP